LTHAAVPGDAVRGAARAAFPEKEPMTPLAVVVVVLVGTGCAVDAAGRRPEASLGETDPRPAEMSAQQRAPGAPKTHDFDDREAPTLTAAARLVPAPPGPVPPASAPPAPARTRAVIVYTARVTMAVLDVTPGLKAIEALAREVGGFSARQTGQSITIRVPAARFDETLERLEKLGDVTGRETEAEDVTAEFVDVEMRLKNARSVRARLEQLLTQATKVADAIAIEKELERVGGEIERLEGRLRYMQDRAQLSTITVTFAPRPRELVAKDGFKLPFPWLDQLGLGRLLDLR
jgi:hypothetical protein